MDRKKARQWANVSTVLLLLAGGLNLQCTTTRPASHTVAAESSLTSVTPLAGPYLIGWASDSLVVRWESGDTCDGTVVLSPGRKEETSIGGAEATGVRTNDRVRHPICEAKLPPLEPCRAYSYRLDIQGVTGLVSRFSAPPVPGGLCPGGLKIALIGDTRTGHRVHTRLARLVSAFKPHLLLHTGDLVDHHDRIDEWRMFFSIEGRTLAAAPFAISPGNHEVLPEGEQSSFGAFLMNRYFRTEMGGGTGHFTFDFGPVHVVVLDTYFGEQLDNGGMDWLKQHLASLPADRLKFVLLHEPPITFGKYKPGVELMYLRRVLLKHRVDVVGAGHIHFYEHFAVDGTHFITSGGGGAELHHPRALVVKEEEQYMQKTARVNQFVTLEIDETAVQFKCIDVEGNVVEEWKVMW